MKNCLRIFVFSFLFISLSKNIYSFTYGGTGPSLYLEDNASAANVSLGGAGSGTDLGFMWQNPAMLYDSLDGRTVDLSYMVDPTSFNENFGFAAFGFPTKIGKFIVGFSFLQNSLLESYDSTGKFLEHYSTTEMLGGVAHTLKLTDYLYIGETFKFFYMDYSFVNSIAFSVDLAVMFRFLNIFYISLSLDNLASFPFNFTGTYEWLPAMAKLSPSVHLFNERLKIFYMMNFYLPIYDTYPEIFDHGIGIEVVAIDPYLVVRTGYDGNHFTFGLGSTIRSLDISASYVLKDYEQVVSLTLRYDLDKGFGKKLVTEDGEEVKDNELLAFYEGLRKYNAGDYKGAYDEFNDVLEERPNHELAKKYRERALTHLKSADWLDQEQENLVKMHKDLARKYETQKNYGEAIFEWSKVGEINPADPDFRPNMDRLRNMVSASVMAKHKAGLDAYGGNDKIKAIGFFNQALALDPEYEPSKEMLLKIKKELTDEELAEREKIERLQKAQALFTRGLTYYSKKSYEDAIKTFDEALENNPDHEDAKKYRRLAQEEWEREKLGLKGVEAAEKMYNKGVLNVDQGKFYDALGDFKLALKIYPPLEKAQTAFKETRAKLDGLINPLIIDGTSAYNERKFSTAIEDFEKVSSLDPDNQQAKDFLEKIKREKEAIMAVHMKEGKEELEKGKKTKNAKNFSAAIDHFNEVVKLDPKNAEAKTLLDEARKFVQAEVEKLHKIALEKFNAEKYDDAIKDWRNILQIDAAFVTASEYIKEAEAKMSKAQSSKAISEWNDKAQELLENRQYERASIYVNKVLAVAPNDQRANDLQRQIQKAAEEAKLQEKISALFLEGVRDYKKRDYEEAIKKWEEVRRLDPENPLVGKYIPKAIEAQKNRKRIDYINGMKYYDQGNWLLAQSSFARAVREDPKNNDARKMLVETEYRIEEEKMALEKSGDTKLRGGNYSDAVADYTSASRLKKTPELILKRDNAVKAQKYLETALDYLNSNDKVGLSIELFLKILEINPYDSKVRQYLDEAKGKGKKLISRWIEDAQNYEKQGNFKKAYALYTSIIEVESGNAEALKGKNRAMEALRREAQVPYIAGKEAMTLKNYVLAIDKFKEVTDILSNYEDTEDLLNKAIALREEQKRQAAASGSNTGTASPADLDNINKGIVLYRQGKYTEAIAMWEKVPKTSSAYSKAQKYIARARLKK